MTGECAVCGEVADLDEHHKLPLRLGGSYQDWNTVLLCRSCHRVVEQIFHAEFWKKAFQAYADKLEYEEELGELRQADLPKCESCGKYWSPREARAGAHRCR